jgi:hypothetical protein
MVQLLVQPLAAIAESRSGAEYGEWLMDRGATGSHETLEEALEQAARARHGSLESFVRDFVRILDSEGELGRALILFDTGGPQLSSADDLLALILADLRALSANEPLATTRLSGGDRGAWLLASRTLVASSHDISLTLVPATLSPHAPAFLSAFGLQTSIQALGP